MLLSLLILVNCTTLLPKYKYHIDGIKDVLQYVVVCSEFSESDKNGDKHCLNHISASQRMDIDINGNFVFLEQNEERYSDVISEPLYCYRLSGIAEIEGYIKSGVEQYNSF